MRLFVFSIGLFCTLSLAAAAQTGKYIRETLVAPSNLHVLNGLTFNRDGELFVGSVIGQSVYRVDIANKTFSTLIGPPQGMADDIVADRKGNLYWTSIMTGEIFRLDKDATVPRVVASGVPGFNSIAFDRKGRLFSGAVFLNDALYEIDPEGAKPARLILDNLGGLNGFDFGRDGRLYGPSWFRKQIISIDVDKKDIRVVAEGFGTPSSVNFDKKGNLFVNDTARGEIVRVNIKTGEKAIVARSTPGLDNLAFHPDGRLFVTRPGDSAVMEVDTRTGQTRDIISAPLAIAGDLALGQIGEDETLFVADVMTLRAVDTQTGAVRDINRTRVDDAGKPVGFMYVDVSPRYYAVTSWQTGTVRVFERATNRIVFLNDTLKLPRDVLILDNDHILVATDGDKSVWRFTLSSAKAELVCACLDSAGAMTRRGQSVFIAETFAGKISHIDLAAKKRRVLVQGFKQPHGIDVLPDGRLAFIEGGTRKLRAFDPRSGMTQTLADDLIAPLPAPKGSPDFYLPMGLAVAGDGRIFVGSTGDTAVYRYVRW